MVHFVEAEGGFAPRAPLDPSGIDACSTSCDPYMLQERFNLGRSRRLFSLSRDVERFSGTPLASVSAGSAIGALRNLGLRQQFRFLAGGSQGILTEADLQSYVSSQGLPSTYVPQFINYLKKTTAAASAVLLTHAATQQLQRQTDPVALTLPEELPPLPTDLEAFRNFVGSRENALKKAFGMFDKDKHGSISSADLENALRHVTVCCPKSRCMYKRSKQCQEARRIILGATQGAERPIPYPEFRDLFLALPASDVMVKYWLAAGCVPDLDTRIGNNAAGGTLKGASPWGHLLAGAVAGATSRTATAPLETLRLSAMAGTLSDSNIMVAAQNIVNQEGWKGLYKGNLLNVMRAAPQKALDFFAFDMFKRLLGATPEANDGSVPLVRTFLAAGLAGATSSVTLYPLEVLRSRITVAKSSAVKLNVVSALLNIVRTEGPRALYKGLLPSVAAIFPEAAITYGLHDLLKSTYRKFHDGQEPGVLPGLSLGVASAFTGQLVAFPLEAVARRLQLARGTVGGIEGVRQVVAQLMQEGGPRALYRGVGTATVRLIPMAMTSFGTYELVRALLVHLEERQERQEAEREASRACGSLSASITPLEVTPLLASAIVSAPLVEHEQQRSG